MGRLLVASGELSPAGHVRALAFQQRNGIRLDRVLLANGLATESQIMTALAAEWGARRLDLECDPPDARLIDRLGAEYCLGERILPWRRRGDVTVIATAWPEDIARLRPRLEETFGRIALALAPEREIQAALATIRRERLRRRAESSVPARESCRTWRTDRMGMAMASAALAAGLGMTLAPTATVGLLTLTAIVTLILAMGLKVAAIAARLPSLMRERRHIPAPPAEVLRPPVVSILVPMFREPDIAPRLVARLGRLDYPRELLDVLLVTEETDAETRCALETASLPPWMRIISVPDGPLRTKPRAMNYALDFARGAIIGVYDAEDAPDPGQIQHVIRRFAECGPEVACLQGVLDFYNARTNWLSRCFTIEYGTWFRVILPGLQRLGLPLPLGGTTLFFRRAALEELGRWDAHNVTEDADLGIRLARHGYRTEVIPTVTEEEANCRPVPWIRQRSRWLKGYAITWAVHMRDPGLLRRQIGLWPFLGMQAMFLGALSQALLAPVLLSLWAICVGLDHPLAGALTPGMLHTLGWLFAAAETVNIAAALLAIGTRRRRFLMPWVFTMHFYAPLAALAAYKGFYELARNPFYWDKTAHGIFDAESAPDPSPA